MVQNLIKREVNPAKGQIVDMYNFCFSLSILLGFSANITHGKIFWWLLFLWVKIKVGPGRN